MKCKRIRKMLLDYVDDVLDIDERLVIQEHIANCSSCKQELEIYKKLSHIIHKTDYPPASIWGNFLNDLHKRIETEASLEFTRRQNYHQYIRWAFVAVGILLIFFISKFAYAPFINIPKSTISRVVEQPSLINENSESVFVAGIISRTLINEKQASELKKLKKFIDSNSFISANYGYDNTITDSESEKDTSKDEGIIQSILNDDNLLAEHTVAMDVSNSM